MNNRIDNTREQFDFSYDIEIYGDEKHISLPLVIGVIADLRGFGLDDEIWDLWDRNFLWVYSDNFDDRLKAAKPSVMVSLHDDLALETDSARLIFETMCDFEPLAVARQINPLNRVLVRRSLLAELRDKLVAKPALSNTIQSLSERLIDITRKKVNVADFTYITMFGEEDISEFSALVSDIFPELLVQLDAQSEERQQGLIHALADELAHEKIEVELHLLESLESRILQMDDWLANHVNSIIHQPKFQSLEATWRGLHYLVHSFTTSESIKIRFFSASKEELKRDLDLSYKVLFKKCVEEEFSQVFGEPFGLFVADFSVDQSADDLALVEVLAEVAEVAGAPFLAMPKPSLFDCDSFRDLEKKRRLPELFKIPEYTLWNSFRRKQSARFVGLVLPRVVGRSLYLDAGGKPSHFQFQEKLDTMDSWLWMNPAFVLAAQFAQAHEKYGWLACVKMMELGIVVENLPTCDYIDDKAKPVYCCPTEAAFNNDVATQLKPLGLTGLHHNSGSDAASFSPLVSLHKPEVRFHLPANPLTELYPMMFLCNISHFVRCLARDTIGRYESIEGLSKALNNWLDGYVQTARDEFSEISFEKPLANSSIDLIRSASLPGTIEASLWIQFICNNGITPPIELKFFLPMPPKAMTSW
jgi:type VI secretion system protein ImpC